MFFGKRFSGYHGGHLSGLDILVLSIIKNTENITGYDIIQKINKNFKGMWKASAGTIYPLLNRLSEKKTVSIEEIIENNRQKKIYTITETGIEELRDVLENKLQPSIDTLGGFIRTILKAIPKTSCFSMSAMPVHCMVIPEQEESDIGVKNIKTTIQKLTKVKNGLEKQLQDIEAQLSRYKTLLEEAELDRKNNTKIIPITDDDEEFENF